MVSDVALQLVDVDMQKYQRYNRTNDYQNSVKDSMQLEMITNQIFQGGHATSSAVVALESNPQTHPARQARMDGSAISSTPIKAETTGK